MPNDLHKRGRGRPKGSGKKKEIVLPVEPVKVDPVNEDTPVKRGRGRPKGSGKKKEIVLPVEPVKVDPVNEDAPVKRGRGRPKGSGKKKEIVLPVEPVKVDPVNEDAPPVKRGRGRPKGKKYILFAGPVNEDVPPSKRGRGRPKGSGKKNEIVEPIKPVVPEKFINIDQNGNILSLKDLIVVICAHYRNGIKLDELSKKCCEANYKSNSSGKKFVQIIRTNLNTLINNGAIVKDEEKKYYPVLK
jgi:hypothetical protein